MILTRLLARQVRRVFSQAIGARRSSQVPLVIRSGPTGTVLRVSSPDVAVQYSLEGDWPTQRLVLPLAALRPCEGSRQEPVVLERQSEHAAVLRWTDGGVPQAVPVDLLEHEGEFPTVPNQWQPNPRRLLGALAAALECNDSESSRFALGCLQLSGPRGRIAATDGRQLLLQSGFAFPWKEELLVPACAALGCRELAGDDDVLVGHQDDWVVLRRGPWTLWLKIQKDARFPQVEGVIPSRTGLATLTLAKTDAAFLQKTLPKLPAAKEYNCPVTLDLNGTVAIRGRDGSQPATELVLSGSRWEGTPVRLATNRTFLTRAVRLGFEQISITSAEAPLLCEDAQRQYVWATLGKQSAVPPADDVVRIESPTALPESATRPRRSQPANSLSHRQLQAIDA